MRIDLKSFHLVVSEALRAHAQRRVTSSVGRFAGEVARVVVRLTDVNGPRGGVDKRCRIAAELAPGRTLVAEAVDADAYVAVSQAALRIEDRLARVLARARTVRRRPAARHRLGRYHARRMPASEAPR